MVWNTDKEGHRGKISSGGWRKNLDNLKHIGFGKDFVPYVNYWRTLHRKDINEIPFWNTNSDYPKQWTGETTCIAENNAEAHAAGSIKRCGS